MRGGLAAIVVGSALSVVCRAAELAAPAAIPAGLQASDPQTGAHVALDPGQGPQMLAFFATWCRPCLADLSKLTDLEDRWKPDGLRLMLVAVETRQTPDRLRELAAKDPLPGKLLFDADGSVAKATGATSLPAYVLIDRKGGVVARSGVIDAAFKQAVERLVRQEGHAP